MEGGVAALSGFLVLEQLSDLRERETGIVAEVLDEPQSLDIRGVVEAVVALGPGGGAEQPHLFVVAHRSGRQANLRGGLLDAQESRRRRLDLRRFDFRRFDFRRLSLLRVCHGEIVPQPYRLRESSGWEVPTAISLLDQQPCGVSIAVPWTGRVRHSAFVD
jgi:hypothetical protein